jgi:hypothetical protein
MNEKISFSFFRKTLHHKKVKFTWTSSDGEKVKTFETEKFYANIYSHNSISMPKFLLGKEQVWTMINETTFKSESEHGHIIYEVLS